MAMFSYRAADAAGNVIQGTLEAREERQVVAHLQQGGLIPLRINQAETATRWQEKLPLRRGRIPTREVVNFTQELAALLKAGLPGLAGSLDHGVHGLEDVQIGHQAQPVFLLVQIKSFRRALGPLVQEGAFFPGRLPRELGLPDQGTTLLHRGGFHVSIHPQLVPAPFPAAQEAVHGYSIVLAGDIPQGHVHHRKAGGGPSADRFK